ncbi:MAG: hypothetical protein M1604_02315 [Patescibacteria group bacterium]|nr:hypothetical protein [Patescibacteria group bacterium]
MTDQELVKKLVEKKIITDDVGRRVLRDAGLRGQPAEDLIYQGRLADEVAVAKVKSEMLSIPYKKVSIDAVTDALIALIPKETSKTYQVIPVEKNGDMLVVGMLRPDNLQAQEALKFIAKQERVSLGVYLVTPSDIAAVWRKYSPYKNEVESAVEEMQLSQFEKAPELSGAVLSSMNFNPSGSTTFVITLTFNQSYLSKPAS